MSTHSSILDLQVGRDLIRVEQLSKPGCCWFLGVAAVRTLAPWAKFAAPTPNVGTATDAPSASVWPDTRVTPTRLVSEVSPIVPKLDLPCIFHFSATESCRAEMEKVMGSYPVESFHCLYFAQTTFKYLPIWKQLRHSGRAQATWAETGKVVGSNPAQCLYFFLFLPSL